MTVRLVCCVGVFCAASVARAGEFAKYGLLSHRNDLWHGSTYWTGSDWTRVGKDWHHPGIDTPSVRCFRVPRNGRVTVTGRVYKADTNRGGGDGVRVSIRHNARTVREAEIDGNDTRGLQASLTIKVSRGDVIRFVVHKPGRIFYDTTHWDPRITYAPRHAVARLRKGSRRTNRDSAGAFIKKEMQLGPGTAVLVRLRDDPKSDLPAMVEVDGTCHVPTTHAGMAWEDRLDGTARSYAAAATRHIQ